MIKTYSRFFMAAKIVLFMSGLMLAFNGEFILSSAVLGFSVLFTQTEA